jgi:hypothetical protein
VGSHRQIDIAGRQSVGQGAPGRSGDIAGEERHSDPQRLQNFCGVIGMLPGQEFRRGHEYRLTPGTDDAQSRHEGHQCFPGSHFALEKPGHGAIGG